MKRFALLFLLAGLMASAVTGCATHCTCRASAETLACSTPPSPVNWQHPEVGWTLNLPSENP